jgi:ADP-heptose:LPS heptosyltransferase
MGAGKSAPFILVGEPREILVVKPSSLGDVVHTLPAVALVKKRWPHARLRWLVNPEWAPLLEGNPYVDDVILFPRNEFRGLLGLRKLPAWAKSVSSSPADLILDFQGLLRSALVSRLCLAKNGRVVGTSYAREGARFFYHHTTDVRQIRHAVDRYLSIVTALGIPIVPPLEWPLPAGTAPAGFDASRPFILLHPFARGAGKSLSVDDVATLCRALAPARIILAGRSDETVSPLANVENLLNHTSLGELIWLIRKAAFVVSVDSGPMHIAAGLTSSLLAIHKSTDPIEYGPSRPEAWVLKDGALFQAGLGRDTGQRQPAIDMDTVAEFLRTRLQDVS